MENESESKSKCEINNVIHVSDGIETKEDSILKTENENLDFLENKERKKLKTIQSIYEDDAWMDSIDETTSIDELIKQSDKMIGISMQLSQPYSDNIQLEVFKEQLVQYLQSKIDKLNQRIRLVQRKYASYKYYNNVN